MTFLAKTIREISFYTLVLKPGFELPVIQQGGEMIVINI